MKYFEDCRRAMDVHIAQNAMEYRKDADYAWRMACYNARNIGAGLTNSSDVNYFAQNGYGAILCAPCVKHAVPVPVSVKEWRENLEIGFKKNVKEVC